jgi:hypothetical protein
MKATLLLCVALLSGCNEPTCEERGGERRYSHNAPLVAGKTVLMMPQYRCVEGS